MREEELKKDGLRADETQRSVVDFIWGEALVLAPPGCGKTDVLSRRIVKAHLDYGIPYDQMLCLTFTNRASREMQERVRRHIQGSTRGLFIGNLHRFCIRFLHENNLLHHDTSIIDEDDQAEIVCEIAGFSEHPRNLRSLTGRVIDCADILTRRKFGFPRRLISSGKEKWVHERERALASLYIEYKRKNNLIDFDDIINLAYRAMMRDDYKRLKYSNYTWIQVDEIQDLNPLQLAIINKLTDPGVHTTLFLGDERQAIFSFIGASLSGLERLKTRMKIFRFNTNYRSPKYLVDFINRYAVDNFGVTEEELPKANNDIPSDDGLVLFETEERTGYEQASLIAAQTRQLSCFNRGETIGILARTNNEIEAIAEFLDKHKLEYLKLGRTDMFKMVDFKTLYSHLAVVANEFRGAEWSRLLYQTKAVDRMKHARDYVSRLRKAAMSPTDLLREDGKTYLQAFAEKAVDSTFVVFDTETTGLDVYSDDIIQIAALKIGPEGIIPGSEFEVIIETDRQIPETLLNGNMNPMVEVYAHAAKTDAASGLRRFMEYAGDCDLIGHNVGFDIEILRNNLIRRTEIDTPTLPWADDCWDTLKMSRLLEPDQRSHALGSMLKHYRLPGVNSHNAIDDVRATANLALHILNKEICTILPIQRDLLQSQGIERLGRRLRNKYGSYYRHTIEKLHSTQISGENTLVAELEWLYENFVLDKFISPIRKFEYIADLFRKTLVRADEPRFAQQLLNHVYEMRTFSESDLYNNGVVKESIHLMTIHKAKGLQFDNVFIFNVDQFPNFMDRDEDEGRQGEAQRVLYVAISRARKRLYLCYAGRCSRYIGKEMQAMCRKPAPEQLARIIRLEDLLGSSPSN